MTKAPIGTRAINETSHSSDLRSYSFTERRHAIRSAIVGARAVLPDEQSRRAKVHVAKKIWNGSVSVAGTIAETYFEHCGFVYEAEIMDQVRFHPNVLFEPNRECYPALIAPVHNLDGEFVGIHKTYLAPDGKGKAKVRGEPRRMLGRCHGSRVQLSPEDGFRLLVTDNVEAALAIKQACPGFAAIWSAMTPGNLRAPVPTCVKELILCADGDSNNPDGVARLVREAVRDHLDRGVRVSVVPRLPGIQFSELL